MKRLLTVKTVVPRASPPEPFVRQLDEAYERASKAEEALEVYQRQSLVRCGMLWIRPRVFCAWLLFQCLSSTDMC